MNDPRVKRQVWVKQYSLDLRQGSPDYILLSLHPNRGKPSRITIPVALVNEIAEAMRSLANEHQTSL